MFGYTPQIIEQQIQAKRAEYEYIQQNIDELDPPGDELKYEACVSKDLPHSKFTWQDI